MLILQFKKQKIPIHVYGGTKNHGEGSMKVLQKQKGDPKSGLREIAIGQKQST